MTRGIENLTKAAAINKQKATTLSTWLDFPSPLKLLYFYYVFYFRFLSVQSLKLNFKSANNEMPPWLILGGIAVYLLSLPFLSKMRRRKV